MTSFLSVSKHFRKTVNPNFNRLVNKQICKTNKLAKQQLVWRCNTFTVRYKCKLTLTAIADGFADYTSLQHPPTNAIVTVFLAAKSNDVFRLFSIAMFVTSFCVAKLCHVISFYVTECWIRVRCRGEFPAQWRTALTQWGCQYKSCSNYDQFYQCHMTGYL